MQVRVKVDAQDMTKLEKLHYLVEAQANLLSRITSDETKFTEASFKIFMQNYCDTFKEYVDYKNEIDLKYRPSEHQDSAKSWTADFMSKELVYEVK